jgi:hypothetical protein
VHQKRVKGKGKCPSNGPEKWPFAAMMAEKKKEKKRHGVPFIASGHDGHDLNPPPPPHPNARPQYRDTRERRIS